MTTHKNSSKESCGDADANLPSTIVPPLQSMRLPDRVAELRRQAAMRTFLVWTVGLATAVAALVFACGHLYVRGMQRNFMVQARLSLERAYTDYERTGTLPGSQPQTQLSIYTNAIILSGVTQHFAVALDWGFQGGPLAITTNRTVFWIHTNRGPMIIDDDYRIPLFWGGL